MVSVNGEAAAGRHRHARARAWTIAGKVGAKLINRRQWLYGVGVMAGAGMQDWQRRGSRLRRRAESQKPDAA